VLMVVFVFWDQGAYDFTIVKTLPLLRYLKVSQKAFNENIDQILLGGYII